MRMKELRDFSFDSSNRNITKSNKVMTHNQFIERIRKTLYYGDDKNCIPWSESHSNSAISSAKSSVSQHQRITKPLAIYAAELFSETHKGHSLNRLSYITICNLDVTPCSLLLAMIYLDRLCDTDPSYARCITPTELFLVSMMISTKFYSGYDEEIYISEWASYGNLLPEHLKQLELQFLTALDWNIYVSNKEFFTKLKFIEILLARRQGMHRGWLTYTELTNLIPSITIAKTFIQYSTIFLMSYAASIVTIAGAFFIASQVPGNILYKNNVNNINNNRSSAITQTNFTETNPLKTELHNTAIRNADYHLSKSVLLKIKTDIEINNIHYKYCIINYQISVDENEYERVYNSEFDNKTIFYSINNHQQQKLPISADKNIIDNKSELGFLPEIGIRNSINSRSFLYNNYIRNTNSFSNQNNKHNGNNNNNNDDDDRNDTHNFHQEYKLLAQRLKNNNNLYKNKMLIWFRNVY